MIEVRNLSKTYGHKHAVRNLSFKVNEGELFAFLGPNGSGKSTTIKMLTGLTEKSSGDIEILGQQPGINSVSLKRELSFVPDTPDIMGKLTGKEYLDFVASVYQMSQENYEDKSKELLELFDLSGALGTLVEEYSHGMRQKLVITGALMHEPKVIFMDEPNVGLDPKSNRNLKSYLKKYVDDGNTVFLTTHTLGLAEEIADRILIIYEGEEKATGTLSELRTKSGLVSGSLEDVFLALIGEEEVNVSDSESRDSIGG
ncbi:ABC transporter ATP-binding protein [Lacicoccus qingdaonensis]|uniref:ABC-2 type transport system ATP-binding protein n=1 Tax=Lacicoccus qingdaonensis TaxID=576118 RepID=A0A1G9FZ49_9BACL|nr:ABC transporter ATP-binding protein [Salinicoccus qingdaonensis]SDK93443.1 ABC-2 type transport system ATP-binding protein [Salinicoccus qingdaonensis]